MAAVERGNRGGIILTNQGYRYHKNNSTTNKIFWRCWRSTCRAPLQTNCFDLQNADQANILVFNVAGHNHEADSDIINAARVTQQMKDVLRNDPTYPVKRAYDDIVVHGNINADEQEDVPEFSRVRSSLNRVRASLQPAIPRNVDEVVIEGAWETTWSNHQFLSHQDNDWGILIFATSENYRILRSCDEVYIDGTFKSCPKPYTQFVTVHGSFHGRVIPLVMALLTGKQVGQYRQLLQHVKTKVRQYSGHRFRPRRFVSDFEHSIVLAVQSELPNTEISTCYFHFTQSLWRKVQSLGMARDYMRNRRLKRCIRKFMAIGFLPLALVRHNFRHHATSHRTRRLVRRFPDLQDFINYLENNYMDRNGLFTPGMWNVFNRNTDNRTNNHVEGFHQRWNSRVGRRHPSLWLFIRRLKDEQKLQETSVQSAQRGQPAPRRKRKWRDLEQRLQRLKAEYQNGQRNLMEYWHAVTYAVRVFA